MRHALQITCAAILLGAGSVDAREISAGPTDYRTLLATLKAGDTLRLGGGEYRDGLPIIGLHGTAEAPIRIGADSAKRRPRFIAHRGHNTVSIVDSSYVEIADLDLDGAGLAVDAVKAEGHSNYAHHITLERLRIFRFSRAQQTVGISTKCPAWGWVLRDNEIVGVGTGIYLGDSDGNAPFVGGVIEGNLVADTTGYNLQIKHQSARPELDGLPHAPQRTLIRHNVFAKSAASSRGEDARPNVLLGHFPVAGDGHLDEYVFYGNFVFNNPGEALLQGEGNLAIYNNVFVNRQGDGVVVQPHHDRPRHIRVFHNTVVVAGAGIRIAGVAPGYTAFVARNVVFAERPLEGVDDRSNVVGSLGVAAYWLRAPAAAPGSGLDVTPSRTMRAAAPPLAGVADLPETGIDFDGNPRTPDDFGGYALGRVSSPLTLRVDRTAKP